MPRRPSSIDGLDFEGALTYCKELAAENKSMRRQLARLRGQVHEMEGGLKLAGLKLEKNKDFPATLKKSGRECPECNSHATKTVPMTHKTANKCGECGKIWLTEGTKTW